MINRFAENFSIKHHGGIGTEHAERFVRHDAAAPGLGLAARQTLDIGRRGFLIYRSFIDVRTDSAERNADLREQFTPAWRARGEVQPFHQDLSLSNA
ncbi:hypothetical protein D3C72_2138380 [compost metagenome]